MNPQNDVEGSSKGAAKRDKNERTVFRSFLNIAIVRKNDQIATVFKPCYHLRERRELAYLFKSTHSHRAVFVERVREEGLLDIGC